MLQRDPYKHFFFNSSLIANKCPTVDAYALQENFWHAFIENLVLAKNLFGVALFLFGNIVQQL